MRRCVPSLLTVMALTFGLLAGVRLVAEVGHEHRASPARGWAAPTDDADEPDTPSVRSCRRAAATLAKRANARDYRGVSALLIRPSEVQRVRSARARGVLLSATAASCHIADDMPEGFSGQVPGKAGRTRFVLTFHADRQEGNGAWRFWDVLIRTPSAVQAALGNRWHQLNLTCRGGAGDDPDTHVACALRDRMTNREGLRVITVFHEAWKRGDRRTMATVASSDVMRLVRGRAVATEPRDCADSDGDLYCFFKSVDNGWLGVRFRVVRIDPRRLPIWRAVAAAPDCC